MLSLMALLVTATLAQAWHPVARIDATHGREFVRSGQSYVYTASDLPTDLLSLDHPARRIWFGTPLRLGFAGLRPGAAYRVVLECLSDSDARVLQVRANGAVAIESLPLPRAQVVRVQADVAADTPNAGRLDLVVAAVAGPNAPIVSLTVESDDPSPLSAPPSEAEAVARLSVDVPSFVPVPARVRGVRSPVIDLGGAWAYTSARGTAAVTVPGELALQGQSVDRDGSCAYERRFDVPSDWAGKRAILRFDALFGNATVFVNSQRLAQHDQTFVPLDVDASRALRPGTNTLRVVLSADSKADVLGSLSQYAAHPLFGILRQVRLLCLPATHLAEFVADAGMTNGYRDGSLSISARLNGEPSGEALVVSLPGTGRSVTLQADADGRFAGEILVPSVRAWDAEHPNLYRLVAELRSGGALVERFERVVGFRTIEVRGNRLLVNGKLVKLRGVCRHEVDLTTGRSLSPERCRQDAAIFKAANCNYIRTSHYPPSEAFLEACDRVGLFVEVEAPFCWVQHGANETWQSWDYQSLEWLPYLLYGNLASVQANRHHPSVLIWSLANESFWSASWDRVNREVKRLDPTRPTSFHDQCWGGYNNGGSTADVAVYHYPDEFGPARCNDSDRPVLFGEYCHLQCYNRRELEADSGLRDDWGRPLDRMVSLMQASDGCLGGAIWAGIDDLFELRDGRVVGYGPWGPIDANRHMKPEYWHVRKAYSPIRVLDAPRPLPLRSHIELAVDNRFDSSKLSEIAAEWSCRGASGVGELEGPPRARGRLAIDLPFAPRTGDVLTLRFVRKGAARLDFLPKEYRSFGGTIDRETLRFGEANPNLRGLKLLPVQGHDAEMRVGRKTVRIDRSTGAIVTDRSFEFEPSLAIVPLNGESGGGGGNDYREGVEPFNPVCTGWKAESVEVSRLASGLECVVRGAFDEAEGTFSYRFAGDRLTIGYDFRVRNEVDPRQIGIVVSLPLGREPMTLRWTRAAQWTDYPPGHIGSPSGSVAVRATPAQGARRLPWNLQGNALGTNEFRATRTNVSSASLGPTRGIRWTLVGDGSQAVRAWIEGERVRWLVASFNTGGSDGFFATHYAAERRPLKAGDRVQGSATFVASER